eukprot:SM000026S08850  [mRNA]  locus=s26:10859:11427:- [translate_table: standard]
MPAPPASPSADDILGHRKRNPLVPLGTPSRAVATAGVLVAGLVAFKQGKYGRSQQLMRARVGVQAATICLMVATVLIGGRQARG